MVSSLSDWYDTEGTVPAPEDTQHLLLIYTCQSTGLVRSVITRVFVSGENTQTPTFEEGNDFTGTISKSMPVGMSLDNIFQMTVVDRDYIATQPGIPNVDQGSSNVRFTHLNKIFHIFHSQVVSCGATVLGTSEKRQKIHFACSAEYLYAPGRYRIHLILLESLIWMLDDVYEFTVVAQVHHKLAEMFSFFLLRTKGLLSCSALLQ